MKTFLWTTLFWIIAAIAGLVCLGFGDLLSAPVLDNAWIADVLPSAVKNQISEKAYTSFTENVDRCQIASEYKCDEESENTENVENVVEEKAEELPESEEISVSLNTILANQETIYNQINISFSEMQNQINELSKMFQKSDLENNVVDPKEQQRLELQSQIQALQLQMENL